LGNIENNSPFHDLFCRKNGSHRYWLSNDLQSDYLSHRYSRGDFIDSKPDIVKGFLGFGCQRIKNWNLPFSSIIVLPIRFVPDYENSPENDIVAGFISVNCKRKNVFNTTYHTELMAAFADALYIFHSSNRTFFQSKDAGVSDECIEI
jgi:hypothetical protein